ncbi:uncharacterized protein LOC120423447 [Culex pipiens pallens]|uniref:uncharacterized protein LOC120423447 n=1 Tax=Culex pipiens pallens TaxID=42434 RepID=UPI0019542139|nr:uncharacterized protein LOC120423447 [Culex pipiens pallens]
MVRNKGIRGKLVFKRMRPASCRICSCFTTEMGRRLCGCEFPPIVFDKVNLNGEEKDPTEEGNDEKRSEVVSADVALGAGGLRPSAALCAGSDDGTVWDVLRVRSTFLGAGHV